MVNKCNRLAHAAMHLRHMTQINVQIWCKRSRLFAKGLAHSEKYDFAIIESQSWAHRFRRTDWHVRKFE
jgi:hypothetical protein